MRLTSLQIENFRKFDRPVRLEGLGPGINVLAAPNEFGKSTLLAALKTVLFQQHRVRGRIGESMCHVRNATSPVISLGFEIGGEPHHLEKRFMHREPYARLTLPDGSRLEGDAAEERLQSILGFGAPGRTGATPDSVGLWGALWVVLRFSLEDVRGITPEEDGQICFGHDAYRARQDVRSWVSLQFGRGGCQRTPLQQDAGLPRVARSFSYSAELLPLSGERLSLFHLNYLTLFSASGAQPCRNLATPTRSIAVCVWSKFPRRRTAPSTEIPRPSNGCSDVLISRREVMV